MDKVFTFHLPVDLSPEKIESELAELIAGSAKVELRKLSKSGHQGRLGQIDPAAWEVLIRILDTQAAAAAATTVLGAVMGYLFAKTGKKPDVRDEN